MHDLADRARRETSAKLGPDPRLVVCAAVFGLGLGGLLHRALIALLDRWDKITVVAGAGGADLRRNLLAVLPWIVIGLSVAAIALTRAHRSPAWNVRRVAGIALAFAGFVVLVVGELEVHVFRTLAQGWRPHDLFWDVVFHIPGEAIALAGWAILPSAAARPAAARA